VNTVFLKQIFYQVTLCRYYVSLYCSEEGIRDQEAELSKLKENLIYLTTDS
jgi:hypothetical protein